MKKTRNLTNEEFEKVKKYELYIMNNIHTICEKYNIKYSLFYGSLLGAIRHNGFIPWDDDIDIIMSLNDYNRFKIACIDLLPNDLFLQDYDNEPNSCLPFISKMRLNGTMLVEQPNIKKKMNHGVWVDIFVYKTFDGDAATLNKGRKIYSLYKDKVNATQLGSKSFKGKLASILFLIVHPFLPSHYKKCLYKHFKKIDSVGNNIVLANFEPKVSFLNADIFSNLVLCKFENVSFYTVSDYNLVLTTLYGNYMKLPKKEDRVANHSYVKIEL